MLLAVHQPQYIPWLGYFDKIDRADVFVILDNVQYKKNEWQNRNRIRTSEGWQWLTVPVTFNFPENINQVKVNNKVNWKKKHLKTLSMNYSAAPHFDSYMKFLDSTYSKDWDNLCDLNVHLIKYLVKVLGIKTPIFLASKLKLPYNPIDASDRLVAVCQYFGSDSYVAGIGGKDYMNFRKFSDAGIRLVFQQFNHPSYQQRYNTRFEKNLSIVDLLFNCGHDSMKIIRKAQKERS